MLGIKLTKSIWVISANEIQTKLIYYLDDADLLEIVTNFLNCSIFSKSLYKYGVVVGVVLISSCGGDREEETLAVTQII